MRVPTTYKIIFVSRALNTMSSHAISIIDTYYNIIGNGNGNGSVTIMATERGITIFSSSVPVNF